MRRTLLKAIFILLCLFYADFVFTQSRSEERKLREEEKAINEIFGEDDQDFNIRDYPENWKNESAVVLVQKLIFDYERGRSNTRISYREINRKMVLLLDQAAIEEFSEFYYTNSDIVGIKIIKSDGEEVIIDKSEAVTVEKGIPTFYKSYSARVTYKKLAIPDLEIGDIIDYFYMIDEDEKIYGFHAFDPVIFTLESQYPVVKQVVDFTVGKGFYINFNSYHGAPELVETPYESQSKRRAFHEKYTKSYILEDEFREKQKSELWHYSYRSTPIIKFQVVYFKTERQAEESRYFVGKLGMPKKEVNQKEVIEKVNMMLAFTSPGLEGDQILKYIKKNYKKERDLWKKVEAVYYYYRHIGSVSPRWDSWTGSYISVNDYEFVNDLLYVFEKLKISTRVVVFVPRNIGELEDILFPAEITVGLLVKIRTEEKLLMNFSKNSNFLDLKYWMEGVDAYAFSPRPTEGYVPSKEYKIQQSTSEDNQSYHEVEVSLSEDLDGMIIKRHNKLIGHNRTVEWPYVLLKSDYIKEENTNYGIKNMEESTKNKKRKEEIVKELAREKELEDEDRLESIRSGLENEMDTEVTDYKDFMVLQNGRYGDQNELVYEETFVVEEFVQKAGKNYIIEVGKIIGGQVEVKGDELERKHDVYMSYPRSFNNEITFIIPDGYKVEGIEALTYDVENENGLFRSTYSLKGNELKISTSKVYKINYASKDQWEKIVEFLEAAYQFTQEKVILKKK